MMNDLFSELPPPPTLPSGPGFCVTRNQEWHGWDITIPNGELFYSEGFFSARVSDRTCEYLQENESFDWRTADWRSISPEDVQKVKFRNIAWKQDWIQLYGKKIPLPRLTAWYGDPGKSYTYSGIKSEPSPWNKGLSYIKNEIENCAGVAFNSVLLNWYRDGQDQLSWHADDEKELGQNPIIASANFGAERDFVLRRNDDPSQKIVFPLKHGTLLIMRGELQHYWEHSVPKRKKVKESRFNMTFRRIGVAD